MKQEHFVALYYIDGQRDMLGDKINRIQILRLEIPTSSLVTDTLSQAAILVITVGSPVKAVIPESGLS